jgi:hypothetical protein
MIVGSFGHHVVETVHDHEDADMLRQVHRGSRRPPGIIAAAVREWTA